MGRKGNECIIPPKGELLFLFTLDRLRNGVLDNFYFALDKYGKPPGKDLGGSIIQCGLPSNIFIFDALIQFDKFILPYSKKYYEELDDLLINKLLDLSTTKELLNDGLLSFSNEHIFTDNNGIKELCDLYNKNMEIQKNQLDFLGTHSVLTDPYEHVRWLKHNHFITTEKDFEFSNWLSSLDINQLLKKVSQRKKKVDSIATFNYSYKFETKNTLYFDTDTTNISFIFDKIFNLNIIKSFDYILSEIYELKAEIKNELHRKNLIQVELEYETPFGLSLILGELPNNSHPSEMYDVMLEHRKDKSFMEFKEKLVSFDKAIRSENIGDLLKSKKEIDMITNSLKKEFVASTVNNSATTSAGYLKSILEDIISIYSGKPSMKTVMHVLNELEKSLLIRKPKHLQYGQYVGEHILTAKSLEHELKRCFSKKIDSETLNYSINRLHETLLLNYKSKEIANLI